MVWKCCKTVCYLSVYAHINPLSVPFCLTSSLKAIMQCLMTISCAVAMTLLIAMTNGMMLWYHVMIIAVLHTNSCSNLIVFLFMGNLCIDSLSYKASKQFVKYVYIMNSKQTCNSVTFYFMKNSFSGVSKKWILPNIIRVVRSTSC